MGQSGSGFLDLPAFQVCSLRRELLSFYLRYLALGSAVPVSRVVHWAIPRKGTVSKETICPKGTQGDDN